MACSATALISALVVRVPFTVEILVPAVMSAHARVWNRLRRANHRLALHVLTMVTSALMTSAMAVGVARILPTPLRVMTGICAP